MRTIIYLFATLQILLLNDPLMAQFEQWNVDTITVEDGLRYNAVTVIYKDSQGFMWFGTQTLGLQRYDGYNWKNYTYDPESPVGLSNDAIWDFTEDPNGTYWIATSNGLNLLDPDRGLATHYLDPADSAQDNDYRFVYQDHSGSVWAGTKLSLKHFDRHTDSFKRYVLNPRHPANLGGPYPRCVLKDRDGRFWVGTSSDGLYKMDRNSDTFERFAIDPKDPNNMSNSVECLYEDRSGTFWIGTRNGLYRLDRESATFTRVLHERSDSNSLKIQAIAAIIQDYQGQYWIRTYGGLYLYSAALRKLDAWEHRRIYPFGNMSNSWHRIRFLMQDPSGIVWMNNNWHGVVKLIPEQKHFRIYQNHPDFESRSVYLGYPADKNMIWMASGDGLSIYNRKNNTYQLIRRDPDGPNPLASGVTAVHRDQAGVLWAGTCCKGLIEIMETPGGLYTFRSYVYDPDDYSSISGNRIRNIHEDQHGNLYISTDDGGIDVLENGNEQFTHLDYGSNVPASILLVENSGKIWACSRDIDLLEIYGPFTKKGPYRLMPDTVVSHSIQIKKSGYVNWSLITGLHRSSNGIYWLGTNGQGLYKMIAAGSKEKGIITYELDQYRTEDGLSNDNISAILEDGHGRLWLGTENGISRFDPSTEAFSRYGRRDGLAGLQYSAPGYKSPDGEMFFPCDQGLLAFYPDSIFDNPYMPPVVITDLKILNKPVPIGGDSPLQTSISRAREITLLHNQNFLSFEFAALNYTRAEKNQYKYRMEGLDPDWIEAGTRRYASYANLKPGEYTFRVIGSNNDNVWNPEGTALSITILPPWWATVYAYLGYGALVLLLITGFIHFRTGQIRKERDRLEKEVDQRTMDIASQKQEILVQKDLVEAQNRKILEMDRMKSWFFTHVSHEFRTPITLIQGPVEDLLSKARLNKKEIDKLHMVRRNAGRLLTLVNQLLDIAKVESGTMKLKLVEGDVMATLRTIAGAFASAAETKGILYNRSIPKEKFNTWYDPGILEKILVNLLSNAFKFTQEAGEITFTARLIPSASADIPRELECTVADQGPGIPEDERQNIFSRFYQVAGRNTGLGTGIGLSLVKDLVDLCHGAIAVDSEEGSGSTFTVRLPMGKDHLQDSEYVIIEQGEEDRKTPYSAVTAESAMAQPSAKQELDIQATRKPIILIIDDNSDIRSHIRDHLEGIYSVVESVNGQAGLKKAIEIIPDLVVTDLMMPVMDGVELCKQLKSDERTSHVPVIMLTAKAAREDKLEGLETGADDYIAKPFDAEELKVRIGNLIEQRRKLRERYSREITLEPKDIAVTSIDEAFLKKAIAIVEDHMANDHFDMEQFGEAMHMSHSTLFRKLQALTDLSPTAFVRNIRLKRAAQLLREDYDNVARVSFAVGFSNPSHFSRCFKALYGVAPAAYTKTEHQRE